MRKYLWLCSILFVFSLVDAAASEYKVMAWNVEDMDIFDGQGTARVPIQVKKEQAIASVIRKADPDVMFLVEAPSLIEIWTIRWRISGSNGGTDPMPTDLFCWSKKD